MTTHRREVAYRNLPRGTPAEPDLMLFEDQTDGKKKLAAVTDFLALGTGDTPSGMSWHVGVSPPPNPITGSGWFDTSVTPHELKIYNGAVWLTIGPGDLAAIMQAINALTNNLAVEVNARRDGDDLQIVEVATADHYANILAQQVNSDQPLRMIVTADIQVPIRQGVTQAIGEGEVFEFAPRSNSPETYETLPLRWRDNLVHRDAVPVSDEAQWTAAVNAQALLYTHGWMRVTKRFFATVSGVRRAREVGELYHMPPRPQVTIPRFIADTTTLAEVNDIINNAFANGIALWARGPGQNVDAQNKQVYPKAGVFAPGYDNREVLGTDGAGNLSWVAAGGSLSGDDRLALLGMSISPDEVTGRDSTSIQGEYNLYTVNAAALPTTAFYEVQVAGQPVLARRAWTHARTRSFTISAQTATAITDNLAPTDGHVNVDIGFYDAAQDGNSLGLIRLPLGIIEGGGSGIDRNTAMAIAAAAVDAGVLDWAETGNDDPIPAGKLTNAPGLSTKERVGLMSMDISPDSIPDATAATIARSYQLSVTGSDVIDNTNYYQIHIHGENFPRRQWIPSPNIQTIQFTITRTQAGRIAAQIAQGLDMSVQIRFYAQAAGGSVFATRVETVGILAASQGLNEEQVDERVAAGIHLLVETDPDKPVPPTPGKMLLKNSDRRLYTYRPRTLVPRDTAFGIDDFRWTDGVSRTWRGLISNYLTLSGAADGDVVYQTAAAGRTAGFFTRQGGGWSPVTANHAPANWKYYTDLAAASLAAAAGEVALYGTDGTLVVESVLPVAWVLYEQDFPKRVRVADEAAYTAIADKRADTMYWWPASA